MPPRAIASLTGYITGTLGGGPPLGRLRAAAVVPVPGPRTTALRSDSREVGLDRMDEPPPGSERHRIEAVYDTYDTAGDGRWSVANPGNRVIYDEQLALVAQALDRHGYWPLSDADVLDVGCGSGSMLDQLRLEGGATGRVIGLDLRLGRLQQCQPRYPEVAMMACSGASIALPDDSIDVVAAFTLFSSVLDEELQRRIAAEITRVLRPGGIVAWYDLRTPNPANKALRSMTKRKVESLFPASVIDLRSATVLPPLARRLGDQAEARYQQLNRLPFLRSHLVGVVRVSAPGQ